MLMGFLALALTGVTLPHCEVDQQLEKAVEKLRVTVSSLQLDGRLKFVGGPIDENMETIRNTYTPAGRYDSGSEPWIQFLKHLVESQAYDLDGKKIQEYPESSFSSKLPPEWTDLDLKDSEPCEVKYEFPFSFPSNKDNPEFLYRYRVWVRDSNNPDRWRYFNGEFKLSFKPAKWSVVKSFK